jgi:ABC-2 type transport system ATP-binding protein
MEEAMATLQSTAAGSREPRKLLAAAGGRPAVQVAQLRKTYGTLVAVDDVSFSVAEGEIFGILGPNGAGKTTAIECAVGLRQPDAGTVRLFGLDPRADRDQVHEIVGVQLQSGALPAKLRVGEILEEYRSFYRDAADVGELLEVLGLAAKRGDYYRSLSGGQRQRLSVALALIGRPRIAVLDEMTTGLDPQARRDTWELIEGIRDRGVTIVLVTHFMEEAERLCDRVALIDSGRVVALDTPASLAARARGGKSVRFLPSAPFDEELLTDLPEVSRLTREGQHILVTGSGELVNVVILTLAAAGVTARDVQLDSSSLEDAFVKLTGKNLQKEGALA